MRLCGSIKQVEGEVSGMREGEGKGKRTESRLTTVPGGAATSVVVLSTLMIAFPAGLMNVRPLEVAFARSWYVTFPFARKGRYVNEKEKTRTRLTPSSIIHKAVIVPFIEER